MQKNELRKVICLQNSTIRMMSEEELQTHTLTLGSQIQRMHQKRKNSIAGVMVSPDLVGSFVYFQ